MFNGLRKGRLHNHSLGNRGGKQIGNKRIDRPNLNLIETTEDGKEVFICIGDSKTAGAASVGSDTPVAGTAFVFQGGVTQVNFPGEPGGSGSPWAPFCTAFYNASGKKAVIINRGVGSSCFFLSTTTLSWETNGTLYQPAAIIGKRGLLFNKLNKLKGVLMILGVNDFNNGNSITTITNSSRSLIERLNRDFNYPPIYISITHETSNDMVTINGLALKRLIRDLGSNFSNVHPTVNEATIWAQGATYADSIHPQYAGNAAIGAMFSRYILSTETDKDVRRVTESNTVNALSAAHKSAYRTFIYKQKASGRWVKIGALQIYRANSVENARTDLMGVIAATTSATITFNSNDSLSTSGTESINTNINLNETGASPGNENNFILGMRMGTISTAPGNTGCAIGATIASGQNRVYLKQKASSIVWAANQLNSEQEYTGDTSLLPNVDYAIKKTNSTTAALLKDGVQVQSATVAPATALDMAIKVGCSFADGSSVEHFSAQYQYVYMVQASGFDHPAFLIDLNELMAALAIP